MNQNQKLFWSYEEDERLILNVHKYDKDWEQIRHAGLQRFTVKQIRNKYYRSNRSPDMMNAPHERQISAPMKSVCLVDILMDIQNIFMN